MEKQLEQQAAAAPADSGEEGGLRPGAHAQKHPEDQMTLLLRWFVPSGPLQALAKELHLSR